MSATTPQTIKLTYFNGTGRAELTRLLFAFGGIAFEDERINHGDLAALKPSLPLGQLPVLQVDGATYAQSMAIARYAAKLAGLYPADAVDALRADMISETLNDLRGVYSAIMYREPDAAAKAEKTKKMLEEAVPKALSGLEGFVAGKYFLGDDKASYADLQLFDVIVNGLQANFPDFDASPYPKLLTVVESVKANPGVAAYLAK
ncbi:hypothetical protein Gpo141_00005619 [Globisporangium polare]